MFQMFYRGLTLGTWQNGIGMKSKCKMMLIICSHFWHFTPTQNFTKDAKPEKTIGAFTYVTVSVVV